MENKGRMGVQGKSVRFDCTHLLLRFMGAAGDRMLTQVNLLGLWCLGTATKTHFWPTPTAHRSPQTQAKPQLRSSSVANAAPTLLCSGAATGVSWCRSQCAPSVVSWAERLFSCLLLLFSSSGTSPLISREVDSEEMSFAPVFWHMCCSGNVTA